MKLLIDMGNSRVKWRLKERELTLAAGAASYAEGWQWLVEISAVHAVQAVWVSSVAGAEREQAFSAALAELNLPEAAFAHTQAQASGLSCAYADCSRLGVDRWLAMLGARFAVAGPLAVVDSGTAITVDVVTAQGEHQGGWIGPGVQLMRRALAGESGALVGALSEPYQVQLMLGHSTRTAIDGAITMMGRGLIDAALAQAEPGVTLLLTGGDALHWQQAYPDAQVLPELVFSGLERYFA